MENITDYRKLTELNQTSKLRRRGFNGKNENNNLEREKDFSQMSTVDKCLILRSPNENVSELKVSKMFPEPTSNITAAIRKTITTTTKTSYKTPSLMINKRSLSESSAEEANRNCETFAKNGPRSLSVRKMWQNELSINPNSVDAQLATQRRPQRNSKSRDDFIDNSNEKCKKHHSISDMIDVGIRIALVLIFIKLETTTAFQRNIHVEELWLYKNPRTDDIVTPRDLILSVILSPLVISCLHYLLTRDRRDFNAANWVWTLSLCLNGITTSVIKITSGRPRPDFFYRCFPDGQMLANVTPTAINFNCTGEWHVINEGYKSFPSGHSSFAFCSFGFIAFYLAGKLHTFNTVGRGETWRLFASIWPLLLALLIGISRTCDYHHHWQDVLAGGLIGLVVAYITYRQYFPSIFSRHSHRALPRDGRSSACSHGNCFKNGYVRLKNDNNYAEDDLDCEISNFEGNFRFNASDDQLPLICDDETDEQKQRSQ